MVISHIYVLKRTDRHRKKIKALTEIARAFKVLQILRLPLTNLIDRYYFGTAIYEQILRIIMITILKCHYYYRFQPPDSLSGDKDRSGPYKSAHPHRDIYSLMRCLTFITTFKPQSYPVVT